METQPEALPTKAEMEYMRLKLWKNDDIRELYDRMTETYVSKAIDRKKQHQITLVADYIEEARESFKNWGKMQGLSSGYQSVDRLTKGFVGGEVTVVGARTSVGKTTFALNIANNIALTGGSVLFVTMEMTPREVTSRLMSLNGGESNDFYKVSALISYQAVNNLDWQSIDGLIAEAKRELDVKFVVIDHLHYFSRETRNPYEEIGNITKEFKRAAVNHDVPIMLISHTRKMNDNNKQADTDDLRGSSYIGQDADMVLMLGRDNDDKTKMGVRILKNRNRGFDYENDSCDLTYDGIKLIESWFV